MKTYLRFKYVFVLTMLLLAWMPSVRVMAQKSSLLNYAFDDGSLTASVIALADGSHYEGEIVIPKTILHDSKTYNVTSIGDDAFYECRDLTAVIIPNSLTRIGERAFSYCEKLTSVNIPNSVTSIGVQAFEMCGVTSIILPSSITNIENYTFIGSELTYITIPNSVTRIGYCAFIGCHDLVSITIPNSVNIIEEGAFARCSGLTSIVVEGSNPTFDSRENCNAIIETSSNTLIAGCKNTIIPNSVTSIGHSAFEMCSGLTSIAIPNSVTSIADAAFAECIGLTSISLPNSVISIGHSCFYDCSGLESVTIPNSVTTIGGSAFTSCTSLTSIIIPKSVTSIGDGAFYGCSRMAEVISMIERPFEIPENVFNLWYNEPPIATLYVPAGTKEVYEATEGWNKLKNIVEMEGGNLTIPDEAIDLGLPSGTKWAPWNVGASKPEEFGGYYAWGETEEKDVYDWSTYIHCDGWWDSCHDIGVNIDGTQYDVAHVKWGSSWTMPTKEQVRELLDKCTTEWVTVSGVNGRRFTGPNGNSIFLPAGGWDNAPDMVSSNGIYWSSTVDEETPSFAVGISFGSDELFWGYSDRSHGCTVRPVISVSTGIAIDATNFPDANFRNWVLAQDYGQDGVLTADEIAGIWYINVYDKGIQSLQGIEYFTDLIELHCDYNQLTALDVSNNRALTELHCDHNQLTALDVSNNPNLNELWCYFNNIDGQAMEALISSLPIVEQGRIYVKNSSPNTGDENICTPAQAYVANQKGWTVYQYVNWSNWIEMEGEELVNTSDIAIDATNFPDENFRDFLLEHKYGQDGVFTAKEITWITKMSVPDSRNIQSLRGIEFFTELTELYIGYNQLTSLDVSNNTALTRLDCHSNQLTSLNVSNNTALTSLLCHHNRLTLLDISNNTALTLLKCDNNKLISLDVSNNTSLNEIECEFNNIDEAAMDALVTSLPNIEHGRFYVMGPPSSGDGNVCTSAQVAAANAKGWKVYQNNGTDWVEMEGVVDNEDNVFWENDGTHGEINWDATYRFAYEGHQDSGMCIAEFPQDVWDKIKTQRFYMDVVATYPQIRVTNGWWSATWTDDDIYPGNELLTDNGDGTFTVTLNLFDDPDFVRDLDERGLLFTGGGYTPVKLYFEKTEEIVGGETSGSCGDNVFWTYDESTHTLTISGTGDMADFPSGGAPWRGHSSSIKTIVVEDGVTSIGDFAFYRNSGMTSITIPSSVTRIGRSAFWSCNNLGSVYISDIAAWCEIDFGNDNSNPLYYANHLYIGEQDIKDLVIPNSVTSISNYAFFGFSSLASVTIPSSVTNIGRSAFSGCSSLTSVTIPDSVTSIGDEAFDGCYNLTSVTIGNSVASIGGSAFRDCSCLTSVTIPNSVTSIGDEAFSGCNNLISITIGNSVTNIGESAFSGCSSLASVTIPSSVTTIGEYNQEIKGETNVEIISVIA